MKHKCSQRVTGSKNIRVDRQRGRRNAKMRELRVQLKEGWSGGEVIRQINEVGEYIKILRISGYKVTDKVYI